FTMNGTPICTAVLGSSGMGTCSGTLPAFSGSGTVMAQYSGGGPYVGTNISEIFPNNGTVFTGVSTWLPQIAIVWPHDVSGNLTPVAGSQYINTSIWPTNQVSCTAQPNISL